jgi:formiminoglutamase
MLYHDISTFLQEVDYGNLRQKMYNKEQLGYILSQQAPEALEAADIVLLGCGERRGASVDAFFSKAADAVREQFYELYNWHADIALFDAGNIIQGASLTDTRIALGAVLETLQRAGKTVLLIGGSHDLTLQQYEAFKRCEQLVDVTVLDMLIDLKEEPLIMHDNFLFELLTSIPNYVRNFNLQGFQSFATNPVILQTLDRLHFECTRLGKLRGDIEQVEPILRRSHIVSIDVNCIKYSDAPANVLGSPNGLHGPEACTVAEYAGMSEKCTSLGIYGYNEEDDIHHITAKQIAQMLWYFLNGRYFRASDIHPRNGDQGFEQYTVLFENEQLLFYKNKRNARWWIQMPNKAFYACSYKDYQQATNGDLSAALHKELSRS